MFGIPLTFAAPLVLAGLLALPAIWLLLRVTPPRPRHIAFPPLAIFRDLMARRETPARTPWWLLALRLAIAALLILAAAGPVLNPPPALQGAADQPVLMMVDNGATAAHDWRDRSAVMIEQGEAIARDGRSMAVLALAQPSPELQLLAPAAALVALRAIRPAPHLAERSDSLDAIGSFLQAHPGTEIVWISDGAGHVSPDEGAENFAVTLAARAEGHLFTIFRTDRAPALALAGAQNTASGLSATVLRAEPNGRDSGALRAVDLRGL
ncbi:MAG TPA: BatA domain-containing protein, partial [Saliniramus sp.]|nr:BatA domain-containing protein [Saliniramus sp.]